MATTRTYQGATKDEALALAARDLGCSVESVEVLELVTRAGVGGAPGVVEIRVRLPDALQGVDELAILEGFRRRRADAPTTAAPEPTIRSAVLAEPPASARGGGGGRRRAEEGDSPPPGILAERASAFLGDLLTQMGFAARLQTKLEGENVNIEILADKGLGGLLIGRQGQTLDAIQYLVNRVVLPGAAARGRIYLDTEGYREKYRRKIEELAHKYRDEALRAGKPVTLEEFSSRDRWIIHQALLDDPRVTTRSVGEDDDRKLMIIPRR